MMANKTFSYVLLVSALMVVCPAQAMDNQEDGGYKLLNAWLTSRSNSTRTRLGILESFPINAIDVSAYCQEDAAEVMLSTQGFCDKGILAWITPVDEKGNELWAHFLENKRLKEAAYLEDVRCDVEERLIQQQKADLNDLWRSEHGQQ